MGYQDRSENKRKSLHTLREERGVTWLIVCEGEKTEPNYFRGVETHLKQTLGSSFKLKLHIKGFGRSTKSLVKSADALLRYADQLRRTPRFKYAKTFIVFDKDDFTPQDFDSAIFMSSARGYIPLWSNQCFELWLLLHFEYCQSALDRAYYPNRLTQIFTERYHCPYEKSQTNLFDMTRKQLDIAYNNTLKLCKQTQSYTSPAACCPGTTVYRFFELLQEEINSPSVMGDFVT